MNWSEKPGGILPCLFPPPIGVVVIGKWGDGCFRATYTGKAWLVEKQQVLERRGTPLVYYWLQEGVEGCDQIH